MDELVELLAQYEWIYNFKLTRFFVDRVWEKIPTQWNDVLLNMTLEELNSLPFGSVKDDWPPCFKHFIAKCMDHSLLREQTLNIKTASGVTRVTPLDPSGLGADIQRGMSKKKLHEVCHMTALVDHVTKMAGNKHVVDVGSGLGYLGQALHLCYGHQVLGLEGRQCHTSGAEKRSTQAAKCQGLQNVTCELHQSTESREEFQALLQCWLHKLAPDGSTCCHQTGSKTSVQRSKKCDNTAAKIGSSQDNQFKDLDVTSKFVNACKSNTDNNFLKKDSLTNKFDIKDHEGGDKCSYRLEKDDIERNSVSSVVKTGATLDKIGTMKEELNSGNAGVLRKLSRDNADKPVFQCELEDTIKTAGQVNGECVDFKGAKCSINVSHIKSNKPLSLDVQSHKDGSFITEKCETEKCEAKNVISLQKENVFSFITDNCETQNISQVQQINADYTECLQCKEQGINDDVKSVNSSGTLVNEPRSSAKGIAPETDTKIKVDFESSVDVNSCCVAVSESSHSTQQSLGNIDDCYTESVDKMVSQINTTTAVCQVYEMEDQAKMATDHNSDAEKLVRKTDESFLGKDDIMYGHEEETSVSEKSKFQNQTSFQDLSRFQKLPRFQEPDEDHREERTAGEGLVSEERGVCMVGLHCCGDLTPTMLRFFVDLDCIKGLCCVSCCYHRMHYDEGTGQFDNFPMSGCVQEVMSRVTQRYPAWSLNTYAMRLAAQETRARWRGQSKEEHSYHTRNVAYRALLELCLHEGQYVLKKTARKLAHKRDHTSYAKYVDAVISHVQFPDTDSEAKSGFRQHMLRLYHKYQPYFSYIEPFTALQFLLQPVLESLIYTDRQLWLRENGYHSNIIPVFDEFLSPRNLALVAIKC